MVRTKQSGSILEFVIVGSVLALLLIGGAYFVRHNLMAANKNTEPLPSRNEGNKPTQSSSGESDGTNDKENQPQPNENAENPKEEQSTTGGSTGEQPQTENQSETPEGLPQTGPADTLLSGVLLSSAVAVAIVYKRSRNLPASL